MKEIFSGSYYAFLVPLALLGTVSVNAQKKVTHQDMLWMRYSGKYDVSKDWAINLELEDRRFAFPDRQQYWILPRVAVSKSLGNNWSAGAGFVYYLSNSPADPKVLTALTIPELRPYETLNYNQNIKKLHITHRYWLEERFIRKNDDRHLQPGYTFNFRFRYQLGLEYPVTKSEKLKLRVADEIFLNFGHSIVRNTFDQNRIYAGLNYALSKYIQVEADYINQFQEKSNGDNYTDYDILRVTLFQTIHF